MTLEKIFNQIAAVASEDPTRTAVYDGDLAVTYEEFWSAVGAFRHTLSDLPGLDRIGLCLENSLEALVGIYAAALNGVTYIPLGPSEPAARTAKILRDAEVTHVVCRTEGRDQLVQYWKSEGLTPQILSIDREKVMSSPSHAKESVHRPSRPLYLLYTSGSTGTPKGVAIDTSCVEAYLSHVIPMLNLSKQDKVLAHTPLTFDLSVFHLFAPFAVGASLRLIRDPAEYIFPGKALASGVTVVLFATRVTALLLEAGQLQSGSFEQLRHVMFCGERLSATHANAWLKTQPKLTVHNHYGPTEATVACTGYVFPPGTRAIDPVPIGKAFTKMRADFLDTNGQIIHGEAEGELILSGPQVSRSGYWKTNSERFFEHPILGRSFRTGDWVRRSGDGILFWQYRMDLQTKVRGFRVDLGEVESALSQHASLIDVAAVISDSQDSIFVGFTASFSDRTEETIAELDALAKRNLPIYMRPQKYVQLDSLPRTPSGKLDRVKIRQMILSTPH